MSSFNFKQIADQFADLFYIRPETTYHDITVAIRAARYSYEGKAPFLQKDAEAYFRDHRNSLKALAELWIDELPEEFFEYATNVEQDAVREYVCDPAYIDDLWDGTRHCNDEFMKSQSE